MVDDTNHPQFDTSQWPWVVNQTFPQPKPDSCAKVAVENVSADLSVTLTTVDSNACLYSPRDNYGKTVGGWGNEVLISDDRCLLPLYVPLPGWTYNALYSSTSILYMYMYIMSLSAD